MALRPFLSCVFILLALNLLNGQATIYLDKSADCFQEFVWENSLTKETSWSLHIPIGRDGRMILDVDPDAETVFRRPSGTSDCAALNPTIGLVNDVNTGRRVIFIIQQFRPGTFKVYRVDRATYFLTTEEYVQYSDIDLNFSFDIGPVGKRADLSSSRSRYKVFLEEVIRDECPRSWRFRYDGNRNTPGDNRFVVTEGVGIQEGGFGLAASSRLINADGLPVADYLRRNCSGGQPTNLGNTEPSASGQDASYTWKDAGLARIYLDDNSGLYIDRSTWKPADGEIDGVKYTNGTIGENRAEDPSVVSAAESTTTELPEDKPQTSKPEFTGRQSAQNHLPWSPPAAADRRDKTAPLDFSQIHEVTQGESFFSIAERYQIAPDQLRAINGMSDWEIVYPGQLLRVAPLKNEEAPAGTTVAGAGSVQVIPAGAESPIQTGLPPVIQPTHQDASASQEGQTSIVAEQKIISTQQSPSAPEVHIVSKGETLWSIARAYGLSVPDLKKINGLPSDQIQIGQRLRVK